LKSGLGVQRADSQEIREKDLNISYSDWKKLRFFKGISYYMKQNSKSDKPFTLNSHILERINAWENLILRDQVKV
jgi:CRISPR-associated protein Cas1